MYLSEFWSEWVYDPQRPWQFTSPVFAGVFIVFLALYLLIQRPGWLRVAYVTLFSLFFYYKSSGWYVGIMVFSTLVDYWLALWMSNTDDPRKRKWLLITSLVTNLGLLGYFKYTNLFREGAADLFRWFTGEAPALIADPWDIFLPVGISFYTFQTLSYTLDVYRRSLTPATSLLDFAFFVSFFPQLVAGPIVRAADFLPQITRQEPFNRADAGRAIWLIAAGAFKKIVISDYIALNFVDRVFENPLLYSGFEMLMAVYGYALQIYCDFSGYSDMAIGLGLLMGFRLPANFLSPYQSASVREFWRRWHMSLSTWLRDYLYISMGGNRRGKWKTYRNLLLTMLLGGLWHGAHWKFVLWGGLHGMALAVEQFFGGKSAKEPEPAAPKSLGRDLLQSMGYLLGLVYTFHFVCFAWIFFRASDMATAWQIISGIGGGFSWQEMLSVLDGYRPVFLLMTLGFILHFIPDEWEGKVSGWYAAAPVAVQAVIAGVAFWLVMEFRSSDVLPFIYFQF
jgi:D-alanyl-lipoteichoic acid acyltransferase DltB (MBOAT superfamily)